VDKDKKWDRKEVVTVDPGSLLSGGVDIHLYGKGKDYGKHAQVGVEPRKKLEKMLTNIGERIMNELIFGFIL